jgi:phosphoglycolate phosphatase-like HAD superfamily hydrolase
MVRSNANCGGRGICQIGAGRGTSVLVVVDLAVFGVAKPDPSIFQRAVAAHGVAPERTLYVGNSLRFGVRGATAAGPCISTRIAT